jgi:membrane protease YdiL (CAAX protease family)
MPSDSQPPHRPGRAELTRALSLLFGGTFALLGLQLAFPPLSGFSQLGLALLLFQVPWWVLPRGLSPEACGCRFTLGPPLPGLKLGFATLALIALPFLAGFQLLQRDVLGRPFDWSLEHLPRWNVSLWGTPEDLEYAPREICGASRTLIWTQPRTLWVMAPANAAVTVGTDALPGRTVRCGPAGRPVLGPPTRASATSHQLAPGTGLQLALGGAHALRLELRDAAGAPLPSEAMALGARGVEPPDDGRVEATRDLWWLLTFIVIQLGLVALPEEHFFRGYLQGRLDARWGTPWRLLGAQVGWGLPASALAFALLHPILIPGVDRLLVFFPALLFGWLRARQGHLGAAVLVHAGCNLLLAVAVRMVGQTGT